MDLSGKQNSTGYPVNQRYTVNHHAQCTPGTGTEIQRHSAEPGCHSSHHLVAGTLIRLSLLYIWPSGPYPHGCKKKTLTDLISQPSLRAGLIQRPDTLVLPLCLGPASHRGEQFPQVLTSPARSVTLNWIPTRPVFPCALTRLQQIGTAVLGTNVPRRTRRSYAVELTGSAPPSSVMAPRRGLPSLALPRSAVNPGTYADTVRLGISPRMGWNEWTSAYKNVKKVPTRTGPPCAPSACNPCRFAPDQRLHCSKSKVPNPKI